MYYYFIIALQGFCIYHCYSNRNNYYWWLAIVFLPVVGSLAYLFMNVIRKNDFEKAQETLITVINPSKKILDLERKLKFSKTFENQVALADAYLLESRYDLAIENYQASLRDVFKDDFYVLSKLQEAYYFSSRFESSITFAERIKDNTAFKKSRAAFLFGMALEKTENITEAEVWLKTFDAPYNYFMERLELARFYLRNDKIQNAKAVYQDIKNESENMSKQSFKINRSVIKKAIEELSQLN